MMVSLSIFPKQDNEEVFSAMNLDTKECPFCAEEIKAAAKKCKHCGEWMPGESRKSVVGDYIVGDKVDAGDFTNSSGIGIGAGAIGASTHEGNIEIKSGKELRDEHYGIALNWDGRRSMVEFDLSERFLQEIGFQRADLRRANLSGADFSYGSLAEAKLQGANLSDATLTNVNFQRASLQRTNLEGASLTGANFDHAKLGYSKLCKANLLRANLEGANLEGANLEGVNLEYSNLEGAKYTTKTIWPDGFDPKAVGAILVDDQGNPLEDSDVEE